MCSKRCCLQAGVSWMGQEASVTSSGPHRGRPMLVITHWMCSLKCPHFNFNLLASTSTYSGASTCCPLQNTLHQKPLTDVPLISYSFFRKNLTTAYNLVWLISHTSKLPFGSWKFSPVQTSSRALVAFNSLRVTLIFGALIF